jgi:hypothetical protein
MIYLAVSRVISAFCSLLGVKSMDKEKKSGPQKGAEQIEDRPQKQGKKKARSKPQEAPIVEEKLTGAARASTGKSAPTGQQGAPIVEEKPKSGKRKAAGSASRAGAPAGKKGAKSGESAGAREEGSGKLQVSGEEKDREIEGAKSLQAGGNREGAGVEGEGLRDGAKSLQKGGNIQGCGEGGGRAFEHLDDVKKRRVLQHYINSGGQVGKSCRLAGISPQTHYNWLQADPDYKAAYLEAQERSLDVIEQEIIRRGVKGFKEPIIYQGKITGTVRRYSDNLLMFLAKRRDPLYRDNPQLALGLKAAGDIKISLSIPRPEGDVIDAESREISNSANSEKADT